MGKANKRMVVATLLIAALASYADLPRLHLLTSLGDTLSYARVLDPVQCARMLQQVADFGDSANDVRTDLDDGQRSLALINDVSLIQAVVPTLFEVPTCKLADDTPRPTLLGDSITQPLTALGGALLSLDLPPPGLQTHWQPPRLQLPFSLNLTHTARPPPLR
ncbi:MAG: hypothetical protein KDB90_04485 [Planctomycetes bacterium]|nr:hypothetical protein [Planctomycetota bacterium]